MSSAILVCDDNPVVRSLLREILSEGGHELYEAADARESLEVARRVRPDIVILDVVMPDRSGLDVLEELRSDPDLAGTRFVLCTGVTNVLEGVEGGDLGADLYLRKPFSGAELVSAVRDMLAGR